MQACFIGHRTIEITEKLISSLEDTVLTLIEKGVNVFLFGSMSEFDNLSWEVVTKIKERFPLIKRIYVRSSYQFINESYKNYLLKSYEDTYLPKKIENAGKYSYVERNYEMINSSNFCVFYYNEKYEPKAKYQRKNNPLSPQRRNSGTKIAYNYALRKKKTIINLFK